MLKLDKEFYQVMAGILAIIVFVCVILWARPQYALYAARMEGEASFARAEQEKKILIEQARAEMEAAKLRSEAIEIVGEASQKYPEYRLQEFMGAFAEALKEGNVDQIIYVPTEANVPIVERPRR